MQLLHSYFNATKHHITRIMWQKNTSNDKLAIVAYTSADEKASKIAK